MTLLQLFGAGPKWTIRCGNCSADFQKRLPMVDYPHVPCTHCGSVNRVNVVIDG